MEPRAARNNGLATGDEPVKDKTASGVRFAPGVGRSEAQMLIKSVLIGSFILAMSLCALPAVRADASRGEASYTAKCAGCHGPAGRGGSAPSLVPFQWNDAQALRMVREPECDMPAILASELSDEAVLEIFAYLKTIK
jgi:mono/diheme cytochrome c family protein